MVRLFIGEELVWAWGGRVKWGEVLGELWIRVGVFSRIRVFSIEVIMVWGGRGVGRFVGVRSSCLGRWILGSYVVFWGVGGRAVFYRVVVFIFYNSESLGVELRGVRGRRGI